MNLDTDLPFFVGKNKAKLWAWAKKIIVIVQHMNSWLHF